MHARRVGGAQASAQIVRVGHAIKDQQQRRPFDHVEHFVDIHRQLALVGQRHDALVTRAARQAVQAFHRNRVKPAAGALGLLDECLHALVAARGLDVDFLDRLGRVPQPRDNRVKPGQDLGRRHKTIPLDKRIPAPEGAGHRPAPALTAMLPP